MARFDGTLARKLDFGESTTTLTPGGDRNRQRLRLASTGGRLTGPDKYKVLDRQRRHAQIRARHLLDLMG